MVSILMIIDQIVWWKTLLNILFQVLLFIKLKHSFSFNFNNWFMPIDNRG